MTREEQIERDADAVLRASGSGLRHYTMAGTRAAILGTVEGIADRERGAIYRWLMDPERCPFGRSPLWYAEKIKDGAHHADGLVEAQDRRGE